jgi:hypothetical protein
MPEESKKAGPRIARGPNSLATVRLATSGTIGAPC